MLYANTNVCTHALDSRFKMNGKVTLKGKKKRSFIKLKNKQTCKQYITAQESIKHYKI